MNNEELEIKILNIDINNFKEKLLSLDGVKLIKEVTQKIYTYDCYDPIIMYELILKDYEITKSKISLVKLFNFLKTLRPIINNEDKKVIYKITGSDYLDDYIHKNIKNIDINILNNKDLKNIIKDTKNRFFKWIRLRQNGEECELTIKYIYSTLKDYDIKDVKEIEIKVDSFQVANSLLEELGYFRKKKVEKKRISYTYKDMQIEIDSWPLIKPYVEIEGKKVDDIYDLAKKLGYNKKDIRVMNTDNVYEESGINLNDYEVLTFDEAIKRDD